MNKRKANSSGLTIVEILVSVIIISLVMGLLFTLLIQVQKANTDSKKKTSLSIAQNVITKAIEKDLIEVGAKSFSLCSYDALDPNLNIDTTSNYYCVRIAYYETYDPTDVGYILVYRQKEKTAGAHDGNWVMRYSKGYYSNCSKDSTPSLDNNWVETYSVVQKLDDGINLVLNSNPATSIEVSYSANYHAGFKYSEQDINTANLFIPIKDEAGYSYNIDTTFNYRINYPSVETENNKKFNLVCDDKNLNCVCSTGDYCNDSKASLIGLIDSNDHFIYKCSEEKASVGSVLGMNKNFMELDSVKSAKISSTKVKNVYFMDANTYGNRDLPGIDISYSKNGTTMLYYSKSGELYDLYIVQNEKVIIYGKSMANMFKNFTNLEYINFSGLNTSGITNYSGLFYECNSLTTIEGIEQLNFSLVTDVSYMFYNCMNITSSIFRGHTDLGKIISANSLFYGSGLSGTFDFAVDFPAFNVKNINFMLSGTNIDEFIARSDFLVDLNIVSMNNVLAGCKNLLKATIENINFPSLTSMSGLFSRCNKMTEVNIHNIKTPILKDVSSFFLQCETLTNFNISDIDFSSVENYQSFFAYCSKVTGDFDFSYLSFENAVDISFMFRSMSNAEYFIFAHDDADDLVLDKTQNLTATFQYCYNFRGFKGKKPKFTGATTVFSMFNSAGTNSKADIDLSNLYFINCLDFTYMFNGAGFRTIDLSGIHSEVPYGDGTKTINFNNGFVNCVNLVYANLQDAEVKAKLSLSSLFSGCTKLTFVDGINYSSDDSINRYLTGEGDYVYPNGRSPFDNVVSGERSLVSLYSTFKNCSLLRGIPDGYLDGLVNSNKGVWINYESMFEGAFNTEISNSYKISEERYKEIHKVVLPFSLAGYFGAKNMFLNCRNLAVLDFKGATDCYVSFSAPSPDVFKNIGYYALTQNRISSFTINLHDMKLNNHTVKNYDTGIPWVFSTLNLTYNGTKYKMDVYLSNKCDTAKHQYTYSKDVFNNAADTTFHGPSGCSLG